MNAGSTLPRWAWGMLALPAIFILYSISLIVSVSHQRKEHAAGVRLVYRLDELDDAIHELKAAALETEGQPGSEAVEERWQASYSRYRAHTRTFDAAYASSAGIRESLDRIDDWAKQMDRMLVRLRSEPVIDVDRRRLEREYRATVDEGIDETRHAVRRVRVGLSRVDAVLGAKWTQLNILVIVSCVLVTFAGVLFLLHRRESAARRRVEEELREQQSLLASIIDGTDDVIFAKDLEGRYILINSADAAGFGRPAEELVGLTDRDLFPPEVADQILRTDREIIASGQSRAYEESFDAPARRGRTYWVCKYPRFDPHGRVIGVLGIARDITQRKQDEAQARRHHDELTRVSRLALMGEMASGLAHEINQPLCAIATYAKACQRMLIARGESAGDVTEALDKIAGQAQRASEIITRIRNFVAKGELVRRTVQINHVIEEAMPLVRAAAQQHAAVVRYEPGERLPPVRADGLQIQQVLLNLVQNGLEAMETIDPGHRSLVIQTSTEGDGEVEIEVRDRGPGLSPAELKRVFDPFYTSKPAGMGMGLSISKSIVDAHEGRLWGTPNPDGGMAFRISLPTHRGDSDGGR